MRFARLRGQRVLTGLTRILLAEPKVLLLDEPTSNLDVDTEQLILRTLQERLTPDMTLIMVTHKIQLVTMVQRVMLMAAGQIALDCPTADVLQRLQRPQIRQPDTQAGPTTVVGASA